MTFSLVVTAAASAADLFTPSILISANSDDSVQCQLINVSAQSRTVSIQLINESGLAVVQGGQSVVTPGHVTLTGGGGQQIARG